MADATNAALQAKLARTGPARVELQAKNTPPVQAMRIVEGGLFAWTPTPWVRTNDASRAARPRGSVEMVTSASEEMQTQADIQHGVATRPAPLTQHAIPWEAAFAAIALPERASDSATLRPTSRITKSVYTKQIVPLDTFASTLVIAQHRTRGASKLVRGQVDVEQGLLAELKLESTNLLPLRRVTEAVPQTQFA